MGDICGDNRFEIIAKAKKNLLESTNIHTSEDEMKVLDSYLFRCWQMGWLERYDKPKEPLDIPTMSTDFAKEHGLPCPEGYIFKDENGNVINAQKIVLEKKKKEYPKTYEECCEIMNVIMETEIVADAYSERLDDYELNLDTKIENLRKLLICRDAYWKIAGEEMGLGLGKPWEPNKDNIIFGVSRIGGLIESFDDVLGNSHILEFPSAEMRDAFYENFKVEIEACKELL